MIAVRQTWISFVILFLVALLIVVAAIYWQHVTGINTWHVLADGPLGPKPVGC